MPFRKRKVRQTRGKMGVKHADTFLNNIGSGSAPTSFTMVETNAGARTESSQTIQDAGSTDATCRVGDLVKYLNIHIQVAGRAGAQVDVGWLEYAVLCKKESDPDLTITQLGTQTLGETATNMYRNDVLWTGFVPTGLNVASGAELKIKVPKTKQFLKLGDQINLVCYYRSNLSTDVQTDNIRLVQSVNYKCYS